MWRVMCVIYATEVLIALLLVTKKESVEEEENDPTIMKTTTHTDGEAEYDLVSIKTAFSSIRFW